MTSKWFRDDLIDHKEKVAKQISIVNDIFLLKAVLHDTDKITNDVIFNTYVDHAKNQKEIQWGTKERIEYEKKYMKHAIFAHTQNKHHLHSNFNQRDDIDLFDVIEMLCDWIAAMQRDIMSNDEMYKRIEKIFDSKADKIKVEKNLFMNTAKMILSKQ